MKKLFLCSKKNKKKHLCLPPPNHQKVSLFFHESFPLCCSPTPVLFICLPPWAGSRGPPLPSLPFPFGKSLRAPVRPFISRGRKRHFSFKKSKLIFCKFEPGGLPFEKVQRCVFSSGHVFLGFLFLFLTSPYEFEKLTPPPRLRFPSLCFFPTTNLLSKTFVFFAVFSTSSPLPRSPCFVFPRKWTLFSKLIVPLITTLFFYNPVPTNPPPLPPPPFFFCLQPTHPPPKCPPLSKTPGNPFLASPP